MVLTPASNIGLGRPASYDHALGVFCLLSDAGVDVVVASPLGGDPPFLRLGPASTPSPAPSPQAERRARDALSETLSYSQTYPQDFDAAVCLGALDGLDASTAVGSYQLVAALLADGRPVAAVPAGRLADRGPSEGLLIIGNRPGSVLPATSALLAALGRAPKAPITLIPQTGIQPRTGEMS